MSFARDYLESLKASIDWLEGEDQDNIWANLMGYDWQRRQEVALKLRRRILWTLVTEGKLTTRETKMMVVTNDGRSHDETRRVWSVK